MLKQTEMCQILKDQILNLWITLNFDADFLEDDCFCQWTVGTAEYPFKTVIKNTNVSF